MNSPINREIAQLIQRLPKTETHLHIEGALPWELLNQLDPGKHPSPPKSWNYDFRFNSFDEFESLLLGLAMPWFQSPERYYEAARVIFERLQREENVRYVETSFASGVLEFVGLDGEKVAQAIKQAAPGGMTVKVFMGIHHNGYNDRSRDFIEASLGWDSLDGIDLHGTESFPLESWTADFWERARAAGKLTKAHAGEFCGPDFVERVVKELGVKRIQHGVRAAESPALLRELADLGVAFDMCPISNLKLRVVESIQKHPIRQIIDAGVRCTINTDDPLTFGNKLGQEYAILHAEAGFSADELVNLARTGLELAEVDDNLRQMWLDDLDVAVLRSLSPLE